MIEIVIKEFLDGQLSVPSFFERPSNPPTRFVLIEKTSGIKRNQVKSSTFAFQSYAESMYEAIKINEEIKGLIENLIEVDEVSGVHLNSDYNFTDTETKQYRYQAVFDINHY
ncbi:MULTISPECIES: hypothetical protein [unclassified Enterococcus]|uniref:hypothetical protein n=1 Tax=unclassified Enterococcus TaxID=2608891 RepID=UPI001554BEE8|nr:MULTISPECIES: hypothetical protein [unclassified Enterococcus]MBS7578406.1 hypothetical protein [Enterococcus sp. MMGLQ5-2]MBS7585637.1 hypothetical protein [Enterococcus sp. MMGLQ5-1]NPD13496.1 hypothetical protein [Enterococcus sp. MMGLQ5-1]NPD38238.1 hypothetical protein [Enterococcus sp. MMGLQ5-2]